MPPRRTPGQDAELDRLLDAPFSGTRRGATRGGTAGQPRPQPPAPAARRPAGRPRPADSGNRAARQLTDQKIADAVRAGQDAPPPAGQVRGQPARQAAPRPDRTAARAEANGAGGLLALFAYPVLLALLKGGPPRAAGWIKAKFFNEPYQAAPASGGSSSRPSGGAGPGKRRG